MNYLEKDKLYCSQGDTSGKHKPKKIFIGAEDCYLFDECSIKYLDMQMYNSAANFGYKNKAYSECIKNCLETLPCLAGEFMSKSRIELSETICQYMYRNYGVRGRVHFTVGGAQAVDDAMKITINHNHKRGFLAFEGAYHGRTMAASSVSSSYRYTRQFGSVMNVQRIPFSNCFTCAYDKNPTDCDLYCLKKFKQKFKSEFSGFYDKNHSDAAYSAFIFEPVLGRGGYVFPHEKYYSELCAFLREHNILVVSDEVQMGFYRTGKLWSFEHYNFIPDIIIFGKAITNGLWPLSGIWAREELISDKVWPVGSTHCTFAGHPMGTQLGLCTFNIIEQDNFLPTISKSSELLEHCIARIVSDYSCLGRFQIKGHAVGIDIVHPDTQQPWPELAHILIETALKEPITINQVKYGLILTAGGMFNSSLMLSPCLYMTDDDINKFDILFRTYLSRVITRHKEEI